MNKKGFTLVEVILVIAIIALLLLILVPNVFILVDKNKVKSCEKLKGNIISAAKIYVTNNKYDLNFSCDTPINIKIKTLIDSGDLTGELINPTKDEKINETTSVEVTYDCDANTFNYEYDLSCEPEN